MKFRVEAYIGLGFERYRLQRDGDWRKLGSVFSRNYPEFSRGDSPSLDDRLFDSLEEVRPHVLRRGEIELGGSVYEVGLGGGELKKLVAGVAKILPKVYRSTEPHRFTEGELKEVLASGDDNRTNVLVVDLGGYFRLMGFPEARRELAPIAVRHESFMVGNGYVGFRAARDSDFFERTFLASLEGWKTHLMNDELDVYMDCVDGDKSVSALRREIDYLTKHLK